MQKQVTAVKIKLAAVQFCMQNTVQNLVQLSVQNLMQMVYRKKCTDADNRANEFAEKW